MASASSFAFEAGDIVVRVGLTHVRPHGGESAVYLEGADSGLDVTVGGNTQLGLNLAYFFN